VNNRSIPSTHTVRKITYLSDKTCSLFILLLALTDSITDGEMNTLGARGLEELFFSCADVAVFGSGGKYVLVLHTYVLEYNTVVRLC
jgi:hypothetical protein